MSVSLETSHFVIPGLPEDGSLDITVARYRVSKPGTTSKSSHSECHGERVSLFFMHGISYHKETWIPTIEHLFELQNATRNDKFSVIEAWAMDAPNHGQAAIINDKRLLSHPQSLAPDEVSRAIQVFLRSGLVEGTSLIGIAHSASAAMLASSTTGYALDDLPYVAMVLVEPPILTRELYAKLAPEGGLYDILIEMARARKDIWPSREAAREWMAKRPPWRTWSPRCLDLYVEHGLRDLPTMTYPDRTDGVTLCCTREQEAPEYGMFTFHSMDRLGEVCPVIPVHCIFGERTDLIPKFVRDAFLGAKQTRSIASITTIPGAGHLVPQEDPKNLALAIWESLHRTWGQRGRRSHL